MTAIVKRSTSVRRPQPFRNRKPGTTAARRPALGERLRTAARELVRREPETVWFGAVLLAGMILRLWRPDWYLDRQFHPDERWIFGVVSQLSYPDAPAGLQYGTFPLYLLATIKDIAAGLAAWFGAFDVNRFVIGAGRTLSALFDGGTLVFTYLLGRRLGDGAAGRRLGLLAAGLLAFTVLNIQMAHFFVVDVPLALLTAATLYGAVGIAREGRRRDYLWSGITLGLAMATKTSALPLAVGVGAAHVLALLRAPVGQHSRRWTDLGLAVGASLAAFFAAMPHAILDWSRFWMNQNEQRRILVTGQADVPYNRQYLNTLPYIYYAKNMVRYTLGVPLGLTALAALLGYPVAGVWATVRAAVRKTWNTWKAGLLRESGWVVIFGFGLAYSLVIGVSFAKFNRYLLPLTPVLYLGAARLLADVVRVARGFLWRRVAWAAIGVVVVGTVLWALAFISIYRAEHPWIAASRWLLQHAPASTLRHGLPQPTAILNEEWGDDLPVGVKEVPGLPYRINKFAVQEPDTPHKRDVILSMLPANDIIVMADTRAHAVYRRLPDRYPINAAYYELMFEERLGYRLAADFTNYPRLFGIEFPDDAADESFTLYDHPHVYLFTRQEPFPSPQELAERLDERVRAIQARRPNEPAAPKRAPPKAKAAAPAERPAIVNANHGRSQARPVFILGGINSWTAGLSWLLIIEVIGLLTLPLCWSLFPRLPDAGASLGKIVGTLILTWTTWMLVSTGVVEHRQGVTAMVLLVLGGASVAWAFRRRTEWSEFWQQRGRAWLSGEAVFLATFVGYLVVRAYNPDIHNPFGQGYNGGGEPMGMSFLSAVYYSVHFPPYDPWLSGYPINYYYFGQVILGILAKLTGLPPAWSYNVAIAFLFALTATGMYGLGAALTGRRRWGLAAAAAAVVAGNLHTLFYSLEPLNRGIHWEQLWTSLGRAAQETWRHVGRFEFMWNPTRLIKGTINEMPWFSFLYGDLHAHIIAIPYSLPLIGWSLNLLLPAKARTTLLPEAPGRTGTERGLTFFVTALTLGALSAINTWNFPPYALLVLGVLLIHALGEAPRGRGVPWRAVREAAFSWLRLVIGGLVLMFFFHRHFVPQSTSLAWVNPSVRTTLKDFLVFFGVPVFFLMSFWALELATKARVGWESLGSGRGRASRSLAGRLRALRALGDRHPVFLYSAATVVLGALVLALFDQPLLALVPGLILVNAYVLTARPLTPGLRLSMLLSLLALVVILGCEIVHVRDFMGVGGDMSRMNTVFKFYMVIWIYLALALTAAAAQVFSRPASRRSPRPERGYGWRVAAVALGVLILLGVANFYQADTGLGWLTLVLVLALLILPWLRFVWPQVPEVRLAWSGTLAAVVIVAGLYAPVSLYNRLRLCSGFQHPTLNGEAYLDRLRPKEADALRWINRHLDQNEIVLEAPGRQGYNCFDTRVAIFTGHPSLIGWIGQEEQMRYDPELTGSRTRDADRIFSTPDIGEARRLMDKYGVTYVFVGENEHNAYPALGLQKFSRFMDVAYQDAAVTLYRRIDR